MNRHTAIDGDDLVKRLRAYIPVEGQEGLQVRDRLKREAADEIERLRRELEWSGKAWKAAMEEREYFEKRCHELRRMIPGSGSEH